MPLKTVQTSKRRGREDWWDWEIHLEGSREELSEVEYVEYTLHETFPNPIRRSYDPSDGFKLETSGWGTFEVSIRIHFKDQRKRDELPTHKLVFD
jgi:transcription initiation factor IIF auxiliary subunit